MAGGRQTREAAFVALLRGINVGGGNRVPMAELRALCASLGWSGVATYIQSGNVVFRAAGTPAELGRRLEEALEQQMSLKIPVIVRSAAEWPAYVAGNPFPQQSEEQANLVMLALARDTPDPGTVDTLRERAAAGETIARAGDAVWIHYGNGAGRSRITPALLDRAAGSPVTTRNWRTVLRLADMLAAAQAAPASS